MLQSLNVFEIDENKKHSNISGYGENDNISFGLDIKA